MPRAEGEIPNRLGDLSRDLQAIAGGDQQARQDFVDDLKVFTRAQSASTAVEPFGRRVADAVADAKLNEQAAQQLAHTTWTVVAATELSERQIDALQTELKTNLVTAGVPAERAETVAADVSVVQKTITTRPRRWYEVF
jgi:hypothetical protein